MAIIKIVEAPNGATGQYIKLHKAEIFSEDGTVVITTNLFASQEARDEGKNILWQERTIIPFAAFAQDPRNPFYKVLNEYSFSPFKDGDPDEEVDGDNTVQLSAEAMADAGFGAVIPNYTPPGGPATLTFDAWDNTTMVADGVDQVTIANLPDPTTFKFLKVPPGVSLPPPQIENTGSFGFSTTVPGEYTIQADAFPYLSSITVITATGV